MMMKCLDLLILAIFLLFNDNLKGQTGLGSDMFDELEANAWYLPTEDGNARLYITTLGKGDTVVALHGGPGNNFNYLVDAVRGNTDSICFMLFDQRGSLYSKVPDSSVRDLSLDILVEDLETIRRETGQKKLTLFGHSFGTLLAISYYMKYPHNVRRMVLSASMPPFTPEGKTFMDLIPAIHSRLKVLRSRPAVEAVLREEGLWEEDGLSKKQLSDRFKITGLASFNMIDLRNWRSMKGGRVFFNSAVEGAIAGSIPETYDIRSSLERFPVPVFIIQGTEDYLQADEWLQLIAEADCITVHLVEHASHYIWLDRTREFNRLLRSSLRSSSQWDS
ncbi:alpha/beta fold hydrolase [Sphingobacterium haloxyli]|uniref:AB hydrolase-1 domain-containing protein n=1 Tax=Sphingobacterium haloxyli TaxID=2100533 RepID=A0A2S9IYH2_9SPHI|nr:alpha/beta hydrolase [Sphingobacterium haloxyli]PRD45584.1 hypothetical protein C5745_17905 [Sphingobacterium haloxyli]